MADNKKDYGDEKFIYHMGTDQESEVRENSIHDGYIIIDGETVTFKRKTLVSGKVSIIMPESFTIMPKELAEAKYPSINRPGIIYTNLDTTVNFSVSLKTDSAADEDIPQAKNILQDVVMKLNPASSAIDSEEIKASGKNVAYFDFVTPALDMEVYNVLFFFSLGERLVLGSFNCPKDIMVYWKPVLKQMLFSLEF